MEERKRKECYLSEDEEKDVLRRLKALGYMG